MRKGKFLKTMLLGGMLLLLLTACAAKPAQTQPAQETALQEEPVIHVGSLKGPTSIGLLELMHRMETGEAKGKYQFTMETQADVLLPKMISGELDIALVPANVASVLYNKTQGGIVVIDINTLGVLYMVSGDTGIQTIRDLEGRTIYTTGKGTTPEYVLRHLLEENGVDADLEFKSEATEVAAVLSENPGAIGMLPQPFATVAVKKNEGLSIVLDMTAEWEKTDADSTLVTGVTIVRKEFLAQYPEAVRQFLEEHRDSTEHTEKDAAKTAEYMVTYGILDNAAVAEQSVPYCNIVCIRGTEMKTKLSAYLAVLFAADPASVGGAMPGEDFYYLGE